MHASPERGVSRRLEVGMARGGEETALSSPQGRWSWRGLDTASDNCAPAIQDEGTCWLGATTWRGNRYLRISISNHTTTEDDVDASVAAIPRISQGL